MGGAFEIDFVPDVPPSHWWREYRRLCGKGEIAFIPRPLSTAKALAEAKENLGIEKHVTTPVIVDLFLYAKAKEKDKLAITYCFIVQDCRQIERFCTRSPSVQTQLSDFISNTINNVVSQVSLP